MSVLEVKNLNFSYGKNQVLFNINLKINQGDFIGIIGKTGSGKSTLIQHFNGLLKPDSGQIFFNNKNIWESPKEINKIRFKIGMVFQYPEHQLFEETVFQDIAFGPKNMGLSGNELNSKIISAANFVELDKNLLDKSPFDISGGEKRRVAIAGIIAMDPEILILDEPTAGLDPIGKELLMSHIVNYHKVRKNTIILISHSMEDIARYSDKILVLSEGKVVIFNKKERVFSEREKLLEIGLDIPQVTSIILKLKNLGYDLNSNIFTTEDAVKEIYNLITKN